MDIDILDIKKKKSLHNIKPGKNKISSHCKRRNHGILLIFLLMPLIFLKEIDVYLEESMLGTLKKA